MFDFQSLFGFCPRAMLQQLLNYETILSILTDLISVRRVMPSLRVDVHSASRPKVRMSGWTCGTEPIKSYSSARYGRAEGHSNHSEAFLKT